MQSYFAAEKQEAALFMAVGVLAIGLSWWLWQSDHRLKSALWPLVGVALIQLTVGATVFFRTDAQLAALSTQYAQAPAEYKAVETARMDTVMTNFRSYKRIEVGLLAVGVVLLLAFPGQMLWLGIGGGLMLQSAFMLFLDLFAETRGADYVAALAALP